MPTTQTPPRRLVRRTDDRVVAGVAGGVADALGVDPVLVRIGFVVLAFAGGAGVVAYVALWLLTPEVAGGAPPVAGASDRGPAFWVAIGLFVLAALAIADSVADRSVVWPLVLVGAGVALWRSDGTRREGPPAGGEAASPTAGVASQTEEAAETMPTTQTTAATAPVAPAGPPAAPTQPMPTWTPPPPPGSPPPGGGGEDGSGGWEPPPVVRERSVLGRLTLGVALLALGVLAVLDAADVLDLTVRNAFAVALLVVGLGLVVGTWIGRARWLILPALLLLLPGLVLSTAIHELDVPLGAGIGERSAGATGPADVAPVYEWGIGELTLDLGELDLSRGDVDTSVHLGVGQVTVVVPDDATVDLSWEMTGGRVEVFGEHRVGRSVQDSEVFLGDEGAGTLTLDVRAAFGQIEVLRASDAVGWLPDVDGLAGDGWPELRRRVQP